MISGNLSSGGGGAGGSASVQWLVTDHLGTPRIIVDQTGTFASVKRHDYLPFGEEVFAGTGGRTTSLGYTGGDAVRQQFTQKERDVETGLDDFEARYYSSMQGRFTSPDEFTGGPDELFDFTGVAAENPTFYADETHPQSLNKYQYAYNNPLIYIDPDGHQQALTQRFMFERGPETQLGRHVREVAAASEGIPRGLAKGVANVGIGMHNGGATALGGPCVAPYEPKDKWEDLGMTWADHTLLLGGLLGGKPTVGGLVVAETDETTVVTSETVNATVRQTKQNGAITQPNAAPTGTIVNENGVRIQRFTRDHGPAHLHVEGRGPNTRIGQNGQPLRNNPSLSATQRRVVQNNRSTIRKTVHKVMKEHRYNNQ